MVCNGVTDGSRAFIESWGGPFKCLWFDEALGYGRACNEGAKVSTGEFIVFLNNDTQILGGGWLDLLHQPFADPKMAVTGPMMTWCPYAEYYFLIGFCTMFRREILFQLGLYDESFGAFGEDTDICIRAIKAGYKIAQVPDSEIRRDPNNPNIGIGNFPLYHMGNQSYSQIPEEGARLIEKNRKILAERHGTNISKALEIEGWMEIDELRWLAQAARKARSIIEVGSWYGRSTRALADNMPRGGFLYCVDHWMGQDSWMLTDQKVDDAYDRFLREMWGCSGVTIFPIRMRSDKAAKLLADHGIKADLIFIDGGHQYAEVAADIRNYHPLLKDGGIISGHDYMATHAPGVTEAVLEAFGGNVAHADNTHIFYTNAPIKESKPKVYDCCIFFRELELLDIRFNELYDVVDRFVIVEGTKTHQGEAKPLYFDLNKERYQRFLHKITYIVDDFSDLPISGNKNDDTWARIRHQDESIMRGLTDLKSNDVVMISDVDEIPRASVVKSYSPHQGLASLEMQFYYYFLNCRNTQVWRQAKIMPFRVLKEMGVCNARYSKESSGLDGQVISNAGWHLSYQGGVERIIQKLRSFSHSEYNRWEYLNPERIKEAMDQGKDLFGRPDQAFEFVSIDDTYPRFILENQETFKAMGWIK